MNMKNNTFLELLERSEHGELLKMMDAMLTTEYKRHILQPIISSTKELNAYEVSDGLKNHFSREMMIEELNDISPETKEGLIKYYQTKQKAK